MKRSVLYLLFAVWTALLGLSMAWAATPVLRPPSTNISEISEQQVTQSFTIRLAPLRYSLQSSIKTRFDYDDWSFRETRRRVILLFFIWLAGNAALCLLWLKKRPPGSKA